MAATALLIGLTGCDAPPEPKPRSGLQPGHLTDALPPYAYKVQINLTERAAQKLQSLHEKIRVSAWYYGYATPAAQLKASDMGRVTFGDHSAELEPLRSQTFPVTDKAIDEAGLRDIGNEPYLNINVGSARKSGPNNLIDCSFFENTVKTAEAVTVNISCDLIRS